MQTAWVSASELKPSSACITRLPSSTAFARSPWPANIPRIASSAQAMARAVAPEPPPPLAATSPRETRDSVTPLVLRAGGRPGKDVGMDASKGMHPC